MDDNLNVFQKIDKIVERIDGYMLNSPTHAKLSYSGGRDSHLLLHIIRNVLKYNNEQLPAIYADTHNEYFEIRKRIENQDIAIIDGGRKVLEVFENEGVPLYSKQFSKYFRDIYIKGWNPKLLNVKMLNDYTKRCNFLNDNNITASDRCCYVMKENVLKKNHANITGVRIAESGRRSNGSAASYDFCLNNKKTLFKPIFDVTNQELSDFEKTLKIDVPNIYNYIDRTGCVMCGFGTKKQIIEKINYLQWHEPNRFRFYIKYFEKYLKYRKII